MLSKGSCTHPVRTTFFHSGLHYLSLQGKHGLPLDFSYGQNIHLVPQPQEIITAVILEGVHLSQQGDGEPFVKGIITRLQKL